MLKVTQVKSCIGAAPKQRRTIKALGLKRINHTVLKEEKPEILGMIKKVEHMVKVEKVPGHPKAKVKSKGES